MSKSRKRVEAEAKALGLNIEIIETPSGTHTAQMAAGFVGCDVAQIAKSVVMRQAESVVLFVTSGAHRVDLDKASKLAGAIDKADAALIREVTGFAIGGVSPLGSLTPIRKFFDQNLLAFDKIYAAAGTPNSLFEIEPSVLQKAIQAEIGDFVD